MSRTLPIFTGSLELAVAKKSPEERWIDNLTGPIYVPALAALASKKLWEPCLIG